MKMRLNHYHMILKNPSGYIMLEADVPFTRPAELQKICKQWATIKNAHELEIWRGARYQHYFKQVIGSNHEFRWEKRGPVLWGGTPFKY